MPDEARLKRAINNFVACSSPLSADPLAPVTVQDFNRAIYQLSQALKIFAEEMAK